MKAFDFAMHAVPDGWYPCAPWKSCPGKIVFEVRNADGTPAHKHSFAFRNPPEGEIYRIMFVDIPDTELAEYGGVDGLTAQLSPLQAPFAERDIYLSH